MYRFLYILKKYRDVILAGAAVNLVLFIAVFAILAYLVSPGSRLADALPAAVREAFVAGPGAAGAGRLGSSEEDRVVSVVRAANPAVVSIVGSRPMPAGSALPGVFSQEVGGGAGFLVTPDGLIVTNRHVVDEPGVSYTVYLYDGKQYPAEVVAKDPTQDVAIVKISGFNFSHLKFADSSRLALGQTVIAIGNVFDQFKNSVSVGVVSGLARSIQAGDQAGNIESLEGVIQTDAAINPGNSGGPLLNTDGEVVGVNVAIARGSENVGFALPANTVRGAVVSVMRTGKISRPYLGVRYVPVDEQVKEEYRLPYNYGALVLGGPGRNEPGVAPGSPADRAGIREGQVITELEGKKLEGDMTVGKIFLDKQPGDVVSLKVWEDGILRPLRIRLGEFPLD